MELSSSFGRRSVVVCLFLLVLITAEVSLAEEHLAANEGRHVSSVREELRNRTLVVGTLEAEPYLMLDSRGGPDGPPKFVGFIPDLLLILSRRLHFRFRFKLVDPPLYGSFDNATGLWTGLVGELVRTNQTPPDSAIHLAAAPMTITLARRQVIDFVRPFHNLGMSIIVQRSSSPPSPLTSTSILLGAAWQPLEPSLWATTFALMITTWAILWLMNIYNPHEYGCRFRLGLADRVEAELFNVAGAFWFVFSTLQWQGFERAPRSVASKVLGCVWFAYATFFLTTYIAGVVNTLIWFSLDSVETAPNTGRPPPIVDLAHLLNSSIGYKVGCIADSQTFRYVTEVAAGDEFKVLREEWLTVDGRSLLVPNLTEGLRRIRTEKYALIVEGLVAKLHTNRHPCDLATVGPAFGLRSYGLALPKGSPLLPAFDRAVLELTEDGTLDELERRWYIDRGQCWNVTAADRVRNERSRLYVGRPKRINANDLWGPLVLVIVGAIVTCLIAVAETVFYRYKGKYTSASNNAPLQGHHMRLDPDEGNM